MNRVRNLFLMALWILLMSACSKSTTSDNTEPPPNNVPGMITAGDKSLIESTNNFGFKLFREVSAGENIGDNIFISPLSVSFALGMTYNGADGDTREAMAATLEYGGLTVDEINQSYRQVIDLLTQLDPYVAMQIANSIWYRTGLPVEPTFIQVNQDYFDALVREMDFSAPGAADTINNWVDDKTEGKIEEIVNPPIDPEMVMFLINAVYFKAGWTLPFDTSLTKNMPFYLTDVQSENRQFMMTDTNFLYLENDLFQAIDLPYGDERFSLTVFLPRDSVTVDNLIAEFTAENWAEWTASFVERKVMLLLPKFKFSYKIKLNDVLMALGMEIAFNPLEADFGNMVDMTQLGGNNLYISTVLHKSFVQLDEEGTEAAAVTMVGVGVTSIPSDPVMVVNRPFLFVISEHETESVLFIGKVADPVWED